MKQPTIAVIGSFVQDLAFTVEAFPAPGETRIGPFFTGPGGKGSNQAVAAHRQGVSTTFIGAVGNDIFGHGYQEWANSEGLSTSLFIDTKAPTGAASIVVNQRAENSIVVALGANDALTPDHTLGALATIPQLSILLLQAESNLSATQAALTFGRQHQIFSILNPAPINPDVTTELLSSADCITPNETEAAYLIERLSGKRCRDDFATISDDAIRAICADLPVSTIVLTLGKSGSVLYQREAPHHTIHNVTQGEIVRTESLAITPLDTTGAGDAFNGGLAAGLVRFSGDIKKAIRYATVVAGLSTTRLGTAPSMPHRPEVETYRSFYE
jgi:ribokinase